MNDFDERNNPNIDPQSNTPPSGQQSYAGQPSYRQSPPPYTQQPYGQQVPPYGQQPPYTQQPPYGQQPYAGQQPPYGQPPPYQQPSYGQPPYRQQPPPPYGHPMYGGQRKSKIAAGLFGIFLGVFGVHNFYLGFTGKAIAQLLITVLTLGLGSPISAIWGLIEGILILTGSMNVDANGVPLID